jgi:hypothetical protein
MLQKSNEQYIRWILDLKQKIQQSQIKAAIQVNSALIEMYWDLGKEISERNFENTYGSEFFSQLSKDLRLEFPEIKGFSESNLKYCKRFYLFYYQDNANRHQVGDDFKQNLFLVPWRHHVEILTICRSL